MSPEALNATLLWALRFAYPLTLLILWRAWWPGNWFGVYLAGASIAIQGWSGEDFLWRAMTSAVTGLLQMLATFEIAWEFFAADLNTRHRRGMLHVMYATFVIGVLLVTLGILVTGADLNGEWAWYTYGKTALHAATAFTTIMVMLYARLEQLKALPGLWAHAITWLAYTAPALYGAAVAPRLDEHDPAWDALTNACNVVYLLCLLAWTLTALLKVGRREVVA